MTLLQIILFTLIAFLIGQGGHARRGLLLAVSILAMYGVQPAMPIRNLDFWLPTVTLGIVVCVWAATRVEADAKDGAEGKAFPWREALFIAALAFGVGLTRYLPLNFYLIPTRPPQLWLVGGGVGVCALLAAACWRFGGGRKGGLHVLVWGLVALLVVLKSERLAQLAAGELRFLSGQSPELASAWDIRWIGFSYLAFRLIHTLRDRLAGRLPPVGLGDFVIYVVFFPAFAAGPIDRVQRFVRDLQPDGRPPAATDEAPRPARRWTLAFADRLGVGFWRITWGLFKKFAIADTLALVAIDAYNAPQVKSSAWMWVLLYAYALRIYFDFSGYTDVAIGLGKLMGFDLPENFDRPYFKPNLTVFWNAWHITLAQWFRAYWFNPLTRALRTGRYRPPLWAVILLGQVSTMLLIGLWHGVTWNFAAWGLWHALGLFIHNRWSEATKARFAGIADHPRVQRALTVLGACLTFHYVTLGWVWFALPTPALSWQVFAKLFGV